MAIATLGYQRCNGMKSLFCSKTYNKFSHESDKILDKLDNIGINPILSFMIG